MEMLRFKNIANFLRQFDLFGQKMNLLVKQNETFNSFIGSIISLWIFGFTLMSFF